MPLVRAPPWREALAPADRGLVGNGALPGFEHFSGRIAPCLGECAARNGSQRTPRIAWAARRDEAPAQARKLIPLCKVPRADGERRRHRGELADLVHNDEHRARARLEECPAVHVEKRPVVGGVKVRVGQAEHPSACRGGPEEMRVGSADGAHYPGVQTAESLLDSVEVRSFLLIGKKVRLGVGAERAP